MIISPSWKFRCGCHQTLMPNSLGLWNHIMSFMKIRFSIKKMVQIWLKFSPLLPYLLDTLYCAVVNFPVSGSCTVARLSYKKRERTSTYSRSRQFWTFYFVLPSHRWLEGFRLVWMVDNGFKSAKTFRKVAIRKATSKSRENELTNFCCVFIVLSLFF